MAVAWIDRRKHDVPRDKKKGGGLLLSFRVLHVPPSRAGGGEVEVHLSPSVLSLIYHGRNRQGWL